MQQNSQVCSYHKMHQILSYLKFMGIVFMNVSLPINFILANIFIYRSNFAEEKIYYLEKLYILCNIFLVVAIIQIWIPTVMLIYINKKIEQMNNEQTHGGQTNNEQQKLNIIDDQL